MGRRERLFRFKQFNVNHSKSAMKVGVDGTLIGAWTDIADARKILDIGSGCGLIALMCAQRNSKAEIYASEIEENAIMESEENFNNSPWCKRLHLLKGDANHIVEKGFDYVISNPPFFDAGLKNIVSVRELARHTGELNPLSVLKIADSLCLPDAKCAMILPQPDFPKLATFAKSIGWEFCRVCTVQGHRNALIKRVMVEFARGKWAKAEIVSEHLILEETPGVPTEQYRELCCDFYLKF